MSDANETTESTEGEKAALDAQKRAEKAEKRATDLETADQKRRDEESKLQRDAEMKTLDDAKRTIAELEKREKAALAKADALNRAVLERLNVRLAKLPKDAREQIEGFRDHLPPDKFEKMIEMEFSRTGPGSVDGSPPANPLGGGRRNHGKSAKGRELHPKSIEILESLGEDLEAAQYAIEAHVEIEGGVKKGRFVYPAEKLKRTIRERATLPVLLDEANRRKLFGL